jgi:uncharacterized integral membrane protein
MRARTALLLLILVALGVFAALNWAAFTAPADLLLVFGRTQAPLGVIMLAVTAVITVLYALLLAWVETAALLEARTHARELHAQRQLADSAEASRYAELRRFLEAEVAALRALPDTAAQAMLTRLDRLETELRAEVERSGNTLAAYIGELEDRLVRGDRPGPTA